MEHSLKKLDTSTLISVKTQKARHLQKFQYFLAAAGATFLLNEVFASFFVATKKTLCGT